MTAPVQAVSRPPVLRALRDAVLAAVVAGLLALPLLGLHAGDGGSGLTLITRWNWLGIAVASVFTGRLALSLWGWMLAGSAVGGIGRLFKPIGERAAGMMVNFGWLLVAFAVILPWLPFVDRNTLDKATLVLIYVMLGWGLNIVVGLAGLLDLGYVAFYAVGAYAYALLSTGLGWSFWVVLPLAGLMSASFGILLGFPVLRLRGDYLAIVTMGFGEIIRIVLLNWYTFTNGPDGVSSIPKPTLFGLEFKPVASAGHSTFHDFFGLSFNPDHRITFLYYLILGLALVTNVFTLRIRKLPIGRAWEALREDETACRSLGIDPTATKLSAFAIGAMFAGFAGSFFATRQGFISPESFTFLESAIILAIVVLGGMGSQIGIVLAAVLLVGLPEWFRDLQQYRMLAFGGAMVLIMLWRPRGLLSTREPTISLKEAVKP